MLKTVEDGWHLDHLGMTSDDAQVKAMETSSSSTARHLDTRTHPLGCRSGGRRATGMTRHPAASLSVVLMADDCSGRAR